MQAPTRRVPLHSTCNTRDLGGYPTRDGRVTRFGRLYRSDLPHGMDAHDRALAGRLGLVCVIDLRTAEQAARQKSEFAGLPGVDYLCCPFAAGNRDPSGSGQAADITMEMLSDKQNIARVLRAILAAKGPVLFHCAAGKDRTGILAALLLGAAGVEQGDILADYALSYAYVLPVVRWLREQIPGDADWYGRADPEAMEEVLSRLGGIDGYLCACGLSEAERFGLRERLCGETPF